MPEAEDALIAFGRAICGDVANNTRREWLVTNGLGGYASGTLGGIPTRRYHGYLVAALTPPVDRTVLVGNILESVTYLGQRYDLGAQEYTDGTIAPQGFIYQQSFRLDGQLPVWTYAVADALIKKRVWLADGANTTYITYRVLWASDSLSLCLTPLLACRDFHSLDADPSWLTTVTYSAPRLTVTLHSDAIPTHLIVPDATFHEDHEWYHDVHFREEAARGQDDTSQLFAPGQFSLTLTPGGTCALICTTETQVELESDVALQAARARQADLLRQAGTENADPVERQLVLAADQFIVKRVNIGPERVTGKTVIAGYHWFNDWGRDTMISLPGLTLATGRSAEAADILRTFAQFVADGLLPNNFPDQSGAAPGYNTADATLWYFQAIHAYHAATNDAQLVDDLLPVLKDIADAHLCGTRYGIGVDPADDLLREGAPDVQLTWMDAKVGDWVVTPRQGKPVEINALWYNALRILSIFLVERNDPVAATYADHAARAKASFLTRFTRADQGGLADVVDGPQGDDWSIRPNQIFALALPFPLIEGEPVKAVLEVVGRNLATTYGLRTLAPSDPNYHGEYRGDRVARDGAYHQGPVWTWLMGAYVTAWYRLHQDARAALNLLRPFAQHLADAGLGSVSEILEGNAPHLPRGAIAQAWGVAEVLRVWRWLEGEGAE